MHKKKKIILIGCVSSSEVAFNYFANMQSNKYVLAGVISKSSSNYNDDFVNILSSAKKNSIPTFDFKGNKYISDMQKWIQKIKPDLLFVIGWSHILNKNILSLPSIATIGFHPTEIPKNRGRHPIIWSLTLGLKETASSFFLMDESIDGGSIINQRTIKISIKDDAASLYKKINKLIPLQIKRILNDMSKGSLKAKNQDESQSNSWRKRIPDDGRIDWRMSSDSIYNLIRGLSYPYSGASFIYNSDQTISVFKSEIFKGKVPSNFEPGKIIDSGKNTLLVKTSDGAILLKDLDLKETPKVGEYL